jgi:hypothetical protein
MSSRSCSADFTNDVQSIVTTNQRDFRVFGHFAVLEP